ncbi:hypothetical protein ADK55_19155 [Streptomyces sp. WM4235]|uniref:hypothetical protein n=1 Tax=unclassified Streptomyces TaxID=2593676 RepID=UPI0006AEBA47|nr:hypothetical protein [Streptomyces sp. WM4235]KOU48987.1 hypothetical protein ADK55_19155 [Streptomyces sp. WM4235]
MGSQDQHRRPELGGAIRDHYASKKAAADAKAAPEREQQEKQAKADAALYGTPAWDALSDIRKRRAAQYVSRKAEKEGDAA